MSADFETYVIFKPTGERSKWVPLQVSNWQLEMQGDDKAVVNANKSSVAGGVAWEDPWELAEIPGWDVVHSTGFALHAL